MHKGIGVGAGLVLLLLAGCVPATIHPRALVSPLSFQAAYLSTVHAINVQPYPADTGGWVITQASRSDGFVAAELGERRCRIEGFGLFARTRCYPYRSRVSVTLVGRPDGTTEVNVGTNGTPEARKLAHAIEDALNVREAEQSPASAD